jgi:hypothetical protein
MFNTIEDARAELEYIKALCAKGGDQNVPDEMVYDYCSMQARMVNKSGKGRDDFRDVADAIQDEATEFLCRTKNPSRVW